MIPKWSAKKEINFVTFAHMCLCVLCIALSLSYSPQIKLYEPLAGWLVGWMDGFLACLLVCLLAHQIKLYELVKLHHFRRESACGASRAVDVKHHHHHHQQGYLTTIQFNRFLGWLAILIN